jgi:uncharacterized damage-inducible protein DinB
LQTANDAIAYALTTSHIMFGRFLADLGPQDYLHRPTPKANCAAWIVGHLALSDRGLLKRLGGPLPELPEGFEKRFSRDEGCPQAEEFGDVTKLAALFDEHRTRLITAVKAAPPGALEKPLDKPHPLFKTMGEMVTFMALHATMHAGQISTIRRSLGRPPLV